MVVLGKILHDSTVDVQSRCMAWVCRWLDFLANYVRAGINFEKSCMNWMQGCGDFKIGIELR